MCRTNLNYDSFIKYNYKDVMLAICQRDTETLKEVYQDMKNSVMYSHVHNAICIDTEGDWCYLIFENGTTKCI